MAASGPQAATLGCRCGDANARFSSMVSVALNVAGDLLVRIAQISLNFGGGFCPVSLPLFHGTRRPTVTFSDSMTISFGVKGDSVCSYGGSRSDPLPPLRTDMEHCG